MLRTTRLFSQIIFAVSLGLAASPLAPAQTWTPLTHKAPFYAGTALLLTDGAVMVQEGNAWWRLSPDNTGSYVNGTWAQVASLPGTYNPEYFASAVLSDGRLIINGGEYNNGIDVESNLGAIYDPTSNTWTSVAGPSGWKDIGDAQSVVLANGVYMLGNCCNSMQALLNPTSLTWTVVGTGKADSNSEEGWTLLPDGSVLTVDVANSTSPDHSERFIPSTRTWQSAGSTIVELANTAAFEIGPAVLLANGTVFATGATEYTSIYTPGADGATGTWAPGPTFPKVKNQQLDIADGPATLLTSGNLLVDTSPGVYENPSYFFEYNGSEFVSVPAPPNAPNDPSYAGRMLVLPTGQIFFTDGSNDVEIYTSTGSPESTWAPTIVKVSKTLSPGTTYPIYGYQFNGLSQGAAYGDDAQSATNYPLVRITNSNTGHVFYCRTHNHSSMAVASPKLVSTQFDVPSGIETGVGELVVVANGIPSTPVIVTVN